MNLSVFRKAKKLLKEDKVKLVGTGNAWYFQVEDRDTYRVTISFNGGVRVLPCSCRHGIYKGIKNYLCSHSVACLIWIYENTDVKER